jgi:putative membrane protein insertion efficiency factor
VSVASRPVESVVHWYQVAREGRPSPCRYTPSCSTYALDALRRFGLVRGLWLATRRLARCHPWGAHGFDPVPDTFSLRRRTPA